MNDANRHDPQLLAPAPPAPAEPIGEAAPDALSPERKGAVAPAQKPGEIGGPRGPEPTRYGDWESKGRCSDF